MKILYYEEGRGGIEDAYVWDARAIPEGEIDSWMYDVAEEYCAKYRGYGDTEPFTLCLYNKDTNKFLLRFRVEIEFRPHLYAYELIGGGDGVVRQQKVQTKEENDVIN